MNWTATPNKDMWIEKLPKISVHCVRLGVYTTIKARGECQGVAVGSKTPYWDPLTETEQRRREHCPSGL